MSGFDGEYNDGYVDGYTDGMKDLVKGLECRLKFQPDFMTEDERRFLFELIDDVRFRLEKQL